MKIEKIMLIKTGKRYGRIAFGQAMGILYLVSTLRTRYPGKYQFQIFRQALYEDSINYLRKRFQKFDPEMVGFSTVTMEAKQMEQIARMVKKEKPNCITVLGGPHASFFYKQALETGVIDYVVIGEGEETFPELLETLERDEPVDKVKGIAFIRDGEVILTEPRPFIKDLDSIPFPAWDLVEFKKYAREPSMNGYSHSRPWSMLITTRGCPFKCAYCHNIFGKKVRKRSVENVIEEIELLVNRYGIKELHIIDDIFNMDLPRAKQICDEIVNRRIKVKIAFPNGLRADMMDRELIQKLKKAGCYSMTYAIETASPRIQKLIHKNLNLEKAKQVIEWTYQEGIIPQAFIMLGFPTETTEEIEATIRYALNSKLIRCWFFTVVIYPGAELYKIAQESYPEVEFSNYDWFDFWYWSKNSFYTQFTGINLSKIQRRAYRRFYLRPRAILRIIWWFPKNITFLWAIWWGIRATLPGIEKLEDFWVALKNRFKTRLENRLELK